MTDTHAKAGLSVNACLVQTVHQSKKAEARDVAISANDLNITFTRSECRLTTPSSATPGRGRGSEHGGARRRRGLCRASWRAAQPVTEPVG